MASNRRIKIESKAIRQIQYFGGNLHVWFTNGFFKTYFNVPEELVDAFIKSDSKGKFFNARIKDVYKEG